jgi:uncharacterized protein YbjT (DUF2867 family)
MPHNDAVLATKSLPGDCIRPCAVQFSAISYAHHEWPLMASIQRIAVIGATGMLGQPVTHELIAAGFDVAVVSRSPETARALFPGATVVAGDVFDAASIERALEGQDAVYLNLSVAPHERPDDPHTETDGLRTVIAAARKHGLQRIAYLSSLVKDYQGTDGFDWWVFDVKHEAVRLLNASGVPTTIFYPSTFMETIAHDFMQGRWLVLIGTSQHPMYFIAGQDYGRQVARSFEIAGDERREYVVQGPAAHRTEEAARTFADHYAAAHLYTIRVPLGVVKIAGWFSAQADYGAHIVEAINRYPETFGAQTTWDELGRPTTTVADFARGLSADT